MEFWIYIGNYFVQLCYFLFFFFVVVFMMMVDVVVMGKGVVMLLCCVLGGWCVFCEDGLYVVVGEEIGDVDYDEVEYDLFCYYLYWIEIGDGCYDECDDREDLSEEMQLLIGLLLFVLCFLCEVEQCCCYGQYDQCVYLYCEGYVFIVDCEQQCDDDCVDIEYQFGDEQLEDLGECVDCLGVGVIGIVDQDVGLLFVCDVIQLEEQGFEGYVWSLDWWCLFDIVCLMDVDVFVG